MAQRLVTLLRRQHVAQQVVLTVGRLNPASAGVAGLRSRKGGAVAGMLCGRTAGGAAAASGHGRASLGRGEGLRWPQRRTWAPLVMLQELMGRADRPKTAGRERWRERNNQEAKYFTRDGS